MNVGWLGRALILMAMEQVGKALDARRARRSGHPAPDGATSIEQARADRRNSQHADQDHFEAR